MKIPFLLTPICCLSFLVTGCSLTVEKEPLVQEESKAAVLPPDKSWHAERPSLYTQHAPTDVQPEGCQQKQAIKYLKELQSGEKDIHTITPNDHGAKGANTSGWLTWTVEDPNTLISCPEGGAAATGEVGMCWKELSDDPIVIGLVRVASGTGIPHYHREKECYYSLSGHGMVWAQGKMQPFNPGNYLEITSKAIHYAPNTYDDQDLIFMYWFPQDKNFKTFLYRWPKDVGSGEKLMFDFVPYTDSHAVRSGKDLSGWDVINLNKGNGKK